MTITTNLGVVSYNGNGSTTVFSFAARILDEDEIQVLIRDSLGNVTPQVKTTNYTVSGVGSTSTTVTMLVAPATGETLVIRLNMPFTQGIDYTTGDPFPAESHENGLDERCLENQNLLEEIRRTVQAPAQDDPLNQLPIVDTRKNKILSFTSVGQPETTLSVNDINTIITTYKNSASPPDEVPYVESLSALTLGSWSVVDAVYVRSYYGGWADTVAGPTGGHRRHKTGATNAAPTVGTAVAVSTIGTGVQAGYCWDADGDEWKIDDDEKLYVEKFGAKGDDSSTTENDQAFDDATVLGRPVYIGDGTFRFTSGYTYEVSNQGLIGAGPFNTLLKFNTANGITIPNDAGFGRKAARIAGFSIASISNSCDDKWAIYAPGVAASAAAVYNSGLTIQDIQIGQDGRFGGGMYVKDLFRCNVSRIGFTDVSWMVRTVGSVVQTVFKELTSNNDTAASTINKYGISTESAVYASGTLIPENVKFKSCSYIRGDRGIEHQAGLNVRFVDFDTEADVYGANLNAECSMRGGIFSVGTGAGAWVGVRIGVSPVADQYIMLDDVDVNTLRTPGTPASSYSIDIGDGVSPVNKVVITNSRIRGIVGDVQNAIRGRDCRDIIVEGLAVEDGYTLGDEIDITGRRVFVEKNNLGANGVITVNDGGVSTAYGRIAYNQCTSVGLTRTTVGNWSVANNDPGAGFNVNVEPTILRGNTTWDPVNLVDDDTDSTTVTVTGARAADPCLATLDSVSSNDFHISAMVQADNTVLVTLTNKSGGAVDVVSGNLNVYVFKF